MLNSAKSVKKALSDCAFDPRQPGATTTIVSGADDTYLVQRAQEFLCAALLFQGSNRRSKVRDAVSILAYAMTTLPTVEAVERGSQA